MEHTTAQFISTTDDAWKADRQKAKDCPHFDLQSLANDVLGRWKSARIEYRALGYAQTDRAMKLVLARSLREAEQTLSAVVSAAFSLYQEGYIVDRMDELFVALMQCRMLIVLPVSKRMAEQDEACRSADEIAFFIAKKAQFIAGRAVIDQVLAAQLPSPFKTEGANA